MTMLTKFVHQFRTFLHNDVFLEPDMCFLIPWAVFDDGSFRGCSRGHWCTLLHSSAFYSADS